MQSLEGEMDQMRSLLVSLSAELQMLCSGKGNVVYNLWKWRILHEKGLFPSIPTLMDTALSQDKF